MKGVRIGPGGQLGDRVDLAKQFADLLARIVALAEGVEVGHQAANGVLNLGNRRVGVVLALLFEAAMVLQKLFTEELGETRAGWSATRTIQT